jgi:hypothetical protein
MRKHAVRDGKIGINRIMTAITKECGLEREREKKQRKMYKRGNIPDTITLCQMTLNKVPFVANNELLLGILDRFQGGHSPMVIVS